MVKCIRFVFVISYFFRLQIAPLWFEARVTILFKSMTTVHKTEDKNMKIPKIAVRNVIENLRL